MHPEHKIGDISVLRELDSNHYKYSDWIPPSLFVTAHFPSSVLIPHSLSHSLSISSLPLFFSLSPPLPRLLPFLSPVASCLAAFSRCTFTVSAGKRQTLLARSCSRSAERARTCAPPQRGRGKPTGRSDTSISASGIWRRTF